MNRFEAGTPSDLNCRATRDAAAIWNAAIAAVDGRKLVSEFFAVSGDSLEFGQHSVSLNDAKRICLVAAGKAALAMAAGFLEKLEGSQFEQTGRVFGQINIPCKPVKDIKQQELLRKYQIKVNEVRPANVNLPTQAAVSATQSIQNMVNSLKPTDTCVVLLSGGGSALLTAPREPVTLAEKLGAIEFLFANNADIIDVNQIRAVLSEVKQGGLVRNCRSKNVVTLLISDIIGDPMHLIAGGPTFFHSGEQSDILEIARRFDPEEKALATSIWQLLKRKSDPAQTTDRNNLASIANRSRVRHFMLANNEMAVAAASTFASKLGYQVRSETVVQTQSAEDVGKELIDRLKVLNGKHCIVSGGEPTVQLAPRETRGAGGRNQQLVLAGLQQVLKNQLNHSRDWCLFSAGTDGEDGVSGAAGAWLDADVIDRANRAGLDINESLKHNDAGTFFRNVGGLFQCDATYTNVCDLRIVIRDSV